jgi:hypothetical protein
MPAAELVIRSQPQQESFMKLIMSLSISAFVLMPAIAVAEMSSTGTVSEPNQEQGSIMAGQTSYPDRAAVKKIEAPPSQNGASVKPNEASNQPEPGFMEKAKEKAGQAMGTVTGNTNGTSSSSAKDQPGLMGKAKEFMGTITGRSVGSNESESADVSKGGAIGQATPPKDESKYPDWAAVKKIEGPTSH